MTKDYYLYLDQDNKDHFTLPSGWEALHFVEAEESTPPSIEQMTREALFKPTGALPLQKMLTGVKSIAIIVDDGTRPTPVAKVLGVLLPHLEETGLSRENITIVVAIGTHETMKKEALETRLGKAVVAGYKVVQHNAKASDLVPIQLPGHGGVVKINPVVARADLKIGISSVLPHPMAGYGGGPKIMMPGICDFDFIRNHHMTHVKHPRSVAGVTKGNPFHEGCLEVARAVNLNFAIDCVYNQKGQVIRVIGGAMEAAFAESVGTCFKKLGHTFSEKVDVTITSTYPHTHGFQLMKGVSAPDVITKETGAILLMAPVVSPIAPDFLSEIHGIKEKSGNNPVLYIKDALSKGIAFLPNKAIDYNMAMTTVFMRPKIRTILVSSKVSRNEAESLGMEYASSTREGLSLLEKSHPKAKVAIFPSGGLIVPITAWDR
jgi:lactate racemase